MRIKICGITQEKEIDSLIENKVDYAGFILFFPKSKRNLSCDRAKELIEYAENKDLDIKKVAVVVSPNEDQIKFIIETGFDIIQIHGKMDDDIINKYNIPVFRAYNINGQSEKEFYETANNKQVAGIVLDGANVGSGESFDWNQYREFRAEDKLFILAGGLDPDNVKEAIEILHPDVVDVSSGVEISKEIVGKDLEKIDLFVKRVKNK